MQVNLYAYVLMWEVMGLSALIADSEKLHIFGHLFILLEWIHWG